MQDFSGFAWWDGLLATGLRDVTSDPSALDSEGWWAVVATFEGETTCLRFDRVVKSPPPQAAWTPIAAPSWTSSMDQATYEAACDRVRQHIHAGTVYQVNICRVLSAPCPPDVAMSGLHAILAAGNPAPYAGVIDAAGVKVVSASPELYLARDHTGRLTSGPIKGTGKTAADLSTKDEAENIMITDLVRNDLARAAVPGSVTVPELLKVEAHPGLVHLVTTVAAQQDPQITMSETIELTFPPGSVSGAPKYTALQIINELEPTPRGPYCGGLGFVDADRKTARLAVGIRSFWHDNNHLHFGTGAGITWESDPTHEWHETELKAERLVGLASGEQTPHG